MRAKRQQFFHAAFDKIIGLFWRLQSDAPKSWRASSYQIARVSTKTPSW